MTLITDVHELDWYHTIDLPDGTTTRGWYDTRAAIRKMWFPGSLEGKRCLDVGTCDGFWAFEMEKRGAREVVGIDVDDPTVRDYPAFSGPPPEETRGGCIRSIRTFDAARQLLGSKVQRVPCNVYDANVERLGRFDFAFVGAILLHLRDPVKALTAVRSVTDELLIGDVVWLTGTLLTRRRPVAMLHGTQKSRWWTVNLAGLRRMCEAAGFEVLSSGGPYFVPFGPSRRQRPRLGRPLTTYAASLGIHLRGVPHGWVHARARTS